jgi:hypothetical protein
MQNGAQQWATQRIRLHSVSTNTRRGCPKVPGFEKAIQTASKLEVRRHGQHAKTKTKVRLRGGSGELGSTPWDRRREGHFVDKSPELVENATRLDRTRRRQQPRTRQHAVDPSQRTSIPRDPRHRRMEYQGRHGSSGDRRHFKDRRRRAVDLQWSSHAQEGQHATRQDLWKTALW